MEPDRFKENHFLYIVGIISLGLALTLFFFSLYIGPYLIWNLSYHVPDFLLYIVAYFDDNYDFTYGQAAFIAWLIFFIPCLIFGFISYYVSNRIDNQIHNMDIPVDKSEEELAASSEEFKKEIQETASIGFKIILLMVIIVVFILILQLFFQSTA